MFSQKVCTDVYLYKDGEVSLAEKNLIELLFFFLFHNYILRLLNRFLKRLQNTVCSFSLSVKSSVHLTSL